MLLVCRSSITDTFEGFTLSLLSSLMVSGPNSPFYKSLIEPKIGSDFSSVVGFVRWPSAVLLRDWVHCSGSVSDWRFLCAAGTTAAPKRRPSASGCRGWLSRTPRRSNRSSARPSTTSSSEWPASKRPWGSAGLTWNHRLKLLSRLRSGFEEERIEALLHKIEIQIKHQSTNFGLALASVSWRSKNSFNSV